MQATTTTTDQHIATLRAMNSRQDATAYVAQLRGAELNALAKAAYATSPTVDGKRQQIVQRYVGSRLQAAAIRAL